jgi:hypothetical protein
MSRNRLRYNLRHCRSRQVVECGIGMLGGPSFEPVAYSDADYGADVSRKLTTGLILFLGESPLVWKSQFQRIVTMSTAEAEYLVLSAAVNRALWLKTLLVVFRLKGSIPMLLDNQAATQIARDTDHRTKHIDIHFHMVRERVATGDVSVEHVSSR